MAKLVEKFELYYPLPEDSVRNFSEPLIPESVEEFESIPQIESPKIEDLIVFDKIPERVAMKKEIENPMMGLTYGDDLTENEELLLSDELSETVEIVKEKEDKFFLEPKQAEIGEGGNSDPFLVEFNSSTKTEFPKFDGTNPGAWFLQSNEYFHLFPKISSKQKVIRASLYLEGKAAVWFGHVSEKNKDLNWDRFVALVFARFVNLKEAKVLAEFHKLRVRGSLEEYIDKFEELRSNLLLLNNKGYDDNCFMKCFVNGLSNGSHEFLSLLEHRSLQHVIEMARTQGATLEYVIRKTRESFGSMVNNTFQKCANTQPAHNTPISIVLPNIYISPILQPTRRSFTTGAGVVINWNGANDSTFQKFKAFLVSSHVVTPLGFSKPFGLETCTSSTEMDAALVQKMVGSYKWDPGISKILSFKNMDALTYHYSTHDYSVTIGVLGIKGRVCVGRNFGLKPMIHSLQNFGVGNYSSTKAICHTVKDNFYWLRLKRAVTYLDNHKTVRLQMLRENYLHVQQAMEWYQNAMRMNCLFKVGKEIKWHTVDFSEKPKEEKLKSMTVDVLCEKTEWKLWRWSRFGLCHSKCKKEGVPIPTAARGLSVGPVAAMFKYSPAVTYSVYLPPQKMEFHTSARVYLPKIGSDNVQLKRNTATATQLFIQWDNANHSQGSDDHYGTVAKFLAYDPWGQGSHSAGGNVMSRAISGDGYGDGGNINDNNGLKKTKQGADDLVEKIDDDVSGAKWTWVDGPNLINEVGSEMLIGLKWIELN